MEWRLPGRNGQVYRAGMGLDGDSETEPVGWRDWGSRCLCVFLHSTHLQPTMHPLLGPTMASCLLHSQPTGPLAPRLVRLVVVAQILMPSPFPLAAGLSS